MFSKFKSVLTSDTQEIEDVKVENSKKNFLEQEYEKRKKFIKFSIFWIIFVLLIIFWIIYIKNEKQIKIFQNRVYVSIFWFKIDPLDYKISWFEKLSWWGQVLFLKDVKSLSEANKYNPEKFQKLVKEYQKMWLDLIKTKNLGKFKKQYAKFSSIEDLIAGIKSDKIYKSEKKKRKDLTGSILTWKVLTWENLTGEILSWNVITGWLWELKDLTGSVLTWKVLTWENLTGENDR